MEKRDEKAEQSSDDESQSEKQFINKEQLERYQKYMNQYCGQTIQLSVLKDVRQKNIQQQHKLKKYHIQQLAKQQIQYDQSEFISQLKMKILKASPSKQTLDMKVSYGYFRLIMQVLYSGKQTLSEFFRYKSQLSNVQSYKMTDWKNCSTIKLHYYDSDQTFKYAFRKAVTQKFFLKIASALKTGPRSLKLFKYFDIVIEHKNVILAMESCQIEHLHLRYSNVERIQKMKQKHSEQLYQDLKINHMFGFIHKDIKNDNVGYSHTYQRFVFFDFDLSMMVKQKIGQLTWTFYQGTIHYSDPEFFKFYPKKRQSRADLFYNDLHCLKKTFQLYDSEYNKWLKNTQSYLPQRYTYFRNIDKTKAQCYFELKGKLFNLKSLQDHEQKIFKFAFNQDWQITKQILSSVSNYPHLFSKYYNLISGLSFELLYNLSNFINSKQAIIKKAFQSIKFENKKCQSLQYYYPSREMCLKIIEDNNDNIQLTQLFGSTGISVFAQSISFTASDISQTVRSKMCTIFLSQNKLIKNQSSKQSIKKTFQFLYDHSIKQKDTSVLSYILPSVILMELVSFQQLKDDMESFFRPKQSGIKTSFATEFIQRFDYYVQWIVGIRWITAMVPGIYDSIILEKTLFDSMSRDIKEADSSGFKGRALILLKILKKVEQVKTSLQKLSFDELGQYYSALTEWFNAQRVQLVHQLQPIYKVETYIQSIIMTLYRNQQSYNESLLTTLMKKAQQRPTYFSHIISDIFDNQLNASGSFYLYFSVFKTHFGNQLFFSKMRLCWNTQINYGSKNIYVKEMAQKLQQLFILCSKDNIMKLKYLSIIKQTFKGSQIQLIQKGIIVQQILKIRKITGLQELAQTYPYKVQQNHVHEISHYYQILSRTAASRIYKFKNIEADIKFINKILEMEECPSCREKGRTYFNFFYIEKLVNQKKYQESYNLSIKHLTISGSSNNKNIKNLIMLFQKWHMRKDYISGIFYKLIPQFTIVIKQPYFMLHSQRMFAHTICYLQSLQSPQQQIENQYQSQFQSFILMKQLLKTCDYISNYVALKLAYNLSQSYSIAKQYKIDDQIFTITQVINAYQLTNKNNPINESDPVNENNPLISIFIIVALYNFYARGEPMKDKFQESQIIKLLKKAEKLMKELPSKARKLMNPYVHVLMCYYQTRIKFVGYTYSSKGEIWIDNNAKYRNYNTNSLNHKICLPRKSTWFTRKCVKTGIRHIDEKDFWGSTQPYNINLFKKNVQKIFGFFSHQIQLVA